MKTIAITLTAALAFAIAGCGSIEEVPVNDDAQVSQTGGTAGTTTTPTGSGGTMMPTPTTDGSSSTETKPTTDGNSNDIMPTPDQIIAQLKVVPPQVVFAIGNPQDFQGAKWAYETFNFPIGKKCINSNGNNTAMIWLGGKWQLSGPRMAGNAVINNAVVVSRIATSDELSAAKVGMVNDMTPAFPPLTIDLWMVKHKDTMEADITKINGSSPSPLACTDP